MNTRREFVQWAGAALGGSCLTATGAAADARAGAGQGNSPQTGSDVGSLFPFIQGQAVRSHFPLSFLEERFTDVRSWKRTARDKVFELLQYSPPRCEPRAE